MKTEKFTPQHEVYGQDSDGNQIYRGSHDEHPDYYLQLPDTSWWICDASGEVETEICEPTLNVADFIASSADNGNFKQAVEQLKGQPATVILELLQLGILPEQVAQHALCFDLVKSNDFV